MNYYSKICNRLAIDEFVAGKKLTEYKSDQQVLTYYELSNAESIYKFWPRMAELPPSVLQYASIYSAAGGLLYPHRDHGDIKHVINWYLTTNNSRTEFYVDNGARPHCAIGQQHANIYKRHEVKKVDEFEAQNGDVYLLNVSEIHGVVSPRGGTRSFITMSWSGLNFSEVHSLTKKIFTD